MLMRRFAVCGLFAVALLSVLAGPSLSDSSQLASRSFEFTYITKIPAVSAEAGDLQAWIPLPQSDKNQTITGLSIDSPLPYSRKREAEYGNEYLYIHTPARQVTQPVEIVVRFRVIRKENVVAPGAALKKTSMAPPENPAVLRRALASDKLVPLNGVIEELSRQHTAGLADPLQKAHAVYNYVTGVMKYDKSGEGWGRGDAVWACSSKRGNCTDFHSLFIGMMRAAGIPARFEIGFPLPMDKHEGEIGGYHCWAQFYVESVGWIPVDSSEAFKHPEKRDYFFGGHDENRVLFTTGRDIRLNPEQSGEPLNYFIYPYAEIGGKPYSKIERQFSFRDRPGTETAGAGQP